MKRVLEFFNLLDASSNLSITNAAVIICLIKMSLSAQMNGTEVGALVATLLNYGHKRMINDSSDN